MKPDQNEGSPARAASEVLESRAYNRLIEKLAEGSGTFCSFRKEKQMDYLFNELSTDLAEPGRQVLDICGGYGRLLHFLVEAFPGHDYTLIDASPSLVRQAGERFATEENARCSVGDLYELGNTLPKAFDVTIQYKTLGWLPHYREAIAQMIRATRKRIYLTSPFYEGRLDFISKVFFNANGANPDEFSYTNSYAAPVFADYCRSLGAKDVRFVDMKLDFDMPEPESKDVLQTFTRKTIDGDRLEICGALFLNWKLAIITL